MTPRPYAHLTDLELASLRQMHLLRMTGFSNRRSLETVMGHRARYDLIVVEQRLRSDEKLDLTAGQEQAYTSAEEFRS